jgi:hypothetical protein
LDGVYQRTATKKGTDLFPSDLPKTWFFEPQAAKASKNRWVSQTFLVKNSIQLACFDLIMAAFKLSFRAFNSSGDMAGRGVSGLHCWSSFAASALGNRGQTTFLLILQKELWSAPYFSTLRAMVDTCLSGHHF